MLLHESPRNLEAIFLFPNIRTSLSFSFFIGRADLFRAKTRRWSVIDRYRAHVEILVRSLGLDQEGEGRQGMENYRNARLGTYGVRRKERFCTQNVL